MLVTVTPNTALDRIIFVDDFSLGHTYRAAGVAEGMGGKGAVTSWILGHLGARSIATGFAAGETGRRMVVMLESAGVCTDFLWVRGETRTNYVIARLRDGLQGTITVSGMEVKEDDGRRLQEHVIALLLNSGAKALLCGGSLPEGLAIDWYVPLIQRAREIGVVTLLDSSGPFLVAGATAKPDIIKPNRDEAETLLGRPIETLKEATEAAVELRSQGIGAVVITLGSSGAVAATEEGAFYVPPLEVHTVNTAGAGDGFNAGLLMARLEGADWEEALRRAAAVATAVTLTPETGLCRAEDVARLIKLVRVERL